MTSRRPLRINGCFHRIVVGDDHLLSENPIETLSAIASDRLIQREGCEFFHPVGAMNEKSAVDDMKAVSYGVTSFAVRIRSGECFNAISNLRRVFDKRIFVLVIRSIARVDSVTR